MDDITEKLRSVLSDEESMRQIKELAEMFGGMSGENTDNDPREAEGEALPEENSSTSSDSSDSLFGSIDPFAVMRLIDAFTQRDVNCELISALRPLLSGEKQQKADRAIKMLRLYNVYAAMKEQGMLGDIL